MNSPFTRKEMTYDDAFQETWTPEDSFTALNTNLPDDKLSKMLIDDLNTNVDYWNDAPWSLQETDTVNVSFFLNGYDVLANNKIQEEDQAGNRLFTATRAILSYATGQLAKPELTPSRSDDQYVKMARSMQNALYQHTINEDGEVKVRAAVSNLIIRKRGYLKQRFDPNEGLYGDIVTDVASPDDITIDRSAGFMSDPNKIYHRIRCSVDELVARFPDKKDQIYQTFDIKKGVFTQLSKTVTYFECWFSYVDDQYLPREGVAWFLERGRIILDKMPNPNWIYTGDDIKDKMINVTSKPPKPFTSFNYMNLGKSYIDETSLFDQAKALQKGLNNRAAQFNRGTDYQNGRWVASKNAFSDDDAQKLINKGPRTVAMTNADDARTALVAVTPESLPSEVYESLQDYRNEIDGIMGTPSVFKGSNPTSQDTLGRDQMLKQTAGMLQDDLVRAVQNGMGQYYQLKLQMMRVYYTDDYWFAQKGADGNFDFIMLNSDSVDPGVRISVQADSTLPVDKESIRAQANVSASAGMIDPLTYFIDLGVPDPEIRVERLMRYRIDQYTYMQSVEQGMDNNDAEVDIMLLTAGKQPSERDAYDEGYLDYFNNFITLNRFAMLPQDAKQRLVQFLQTISQKAQQSAELSESMLNDAGIINRPPIMQLPKRTLNVRLNGNMDPGTTQAIAQGEAKTAVSSKDLENAQDPAQGAAPQTPQV